MANILVLYHLLKRKQNPESIIAIENQNRIKLSLEFQGGK
jgi:hypothetical protein